MIGLHVGCGARVEDGWVNIDLEPSDTRVKNVDVRNGLPFDGGSFDFVYSEHFLEHLDRRTGEYFISEASRVLKPGGVLRISTPDMEALAHLYLAALRYRADVALGSVVDGRHITSGARPDPLKFFAPVGWVPEDPCELMNGGMRYWEHKQLWDCESLSATFNRYRFENVARAKHGHTRWPGMLLEGRPSLRDLIIEGQKPQ